MASTDDDAENLNKQTPEEDGRPEQAQDGIKPAGEEAEEQPVDSGEPQVESSDPLAYIDSNRGQRSRTKTPEEGLDEAILLLKAGWKAYGPYQPSREGDKPYMYLRQGGGSKGRVFYVMGQNMDEDGVNDIYAQSPDSRPPASGQAGVTDSSSATGAGGAGGRGGKPTRGPGLPGGKGAESDPGHPMYPYLDKSDIGRPVIYEILNNAKDYQSLVADVGWFCLVTVMQYGRMPPHQLKSMLVEFKTHPESFKNFILDHLESLVIAASKNGTEIIEDLKEQVRVEMTKVKIATEYVGRCKAEANQYKQEAEAFHRNFNIAMSMMDDVQMRSLANAMAVQDALEPEAPPQPMPPQQVSQELSQAFPGMQPNGGGGGTRPISGPSMGAGGNQ